MHKTAESELVRVTTNQIGPKLLGDCDATSNIHSGSQSIFSTVAQTLRHVSSACDTRSVSFCDDLHVLIMY